MSEHEQAPFDRDLSLDPDPDPCDTCGGSGNAPCLACNDTGCSECDPTLPMPGLRRAAGLRAEPRETMLPTRDWSRGDEPLHCCTGATTT